MKIKKKSIHRYFNNYEKEISFITNLNVDESK
jgi:hypothetical protein